MQVFTKEGTIETRPDIYETKKDCRICRTSSLVEVLNLGDQFLPRYPESIDYDLPRAPLVLCRCAACGLLQLQHTVKSDLLFREYWYRSSVNQTMRNALADVVEHGLQYHKDGTWLDIGANDGFLLSQVPKRFHKTACEPAEAFQDKLHEIADKVVGDFFGEKVEGKFDVITSVAMFYDLDDPYKFVGEIARALNPEGVWINQLNDACTMMKKTSFDSICHEHLTYLDVRDLEGLYRQHGLTITRVTHNEVNGGSIRVSARKNTRQREDLLGLAQTKPEDVETFVRKTAKWKKQMTQLCEGPLALGKTYAYGASTKGSVMLQYLGASCFKAVADRNPIKLGRYMAGTWLPIVSEEEMRDDEPTHIFILPWGLSRDEFMRRERATMEAGATFIFPLPSIEFVL
jgi:SAM-dependent methyltransferase